MPRPLTLIRRLAGYGTLGVLLTLLVGYAVYLRGLPELSIWHSTHLDAEYTAASADQVRTIADYRALEDRLFAQLQKEVYDQVPSESRRRYLRYSEGSQADPRTQRPDWNRTFVLPAHEPKGAVLLLHGLSDSPYSLRAIGERLHAQGFYVVGLRAPGHGTAPSGLLYVDWRDVASALRLAARDLSKQLGPGVPLTMIGYSTGAALAVEYSLARLQGEDLPPVARLVLLSPAIGVSPAAKYAVWQGRLAVLIGAPKVAWTDIQPEYDPYKFASFSVNAADLVYQITAQIRERLDALGRGKPVRGLPPILAFSSVADATVSTQAVLDALFVRLAADGHKLVLFDVNRHAEATDFFAPGILAAPRSLIDGPPLPFDLTVVGNADPQSLHVVERTRRAGTREAVERPLGIEWPEDVFSLSHVALPFPPDDPIYGAAPPVSRTAVFLGRPEFQGERGVLAISATTMLRLRHNPFFEPMAGAIDAFVARR